MKTTPQKRWSKDSNKHTTKDDISMANSFARRYSVSLEIREIQIKATMKYHYTCIRMAKMIMIINTVNTVCWQDAE